MENKYNIDDIENFLNQEMSAEDLAAFEQELAKDKDLAAEVGFHHDVVKGIKNAASMDFRNMVSGVHSEMKEEGFFSESLTDESQEKTVKQGAIVRNISLYRKLAFAASFALIIVAAWWVFSAQPSTPEQLFANNFNLHQDVLSLEIDDRLAETGFGTNKEALNILQNGINDYTVGNYQQAINQFNIFQNTVPEDALTNYASFYKAITLLKTEEIATAQTELEAIIQQGTFPLMDDAKWYLALTYLKQEKISNAIALLKTLSQTATYKEPATKLLDSL